MKFGAILTAVFIIFSAVALALPDYSEAARMGGGRSFGSRPSMSTPARQPTMRQQANGPQAAAAAAAKPGLFGGMGGLFGGLLAGTLLGSLLSGHGFSGGGFMDILLIAVLAFLGYKLFMRFRNKQEPAPAGASASGAPFPGPEPRGMNRSDAAASGWNNLSGGGSGSAAMPDSGSSVAVPAGFDTEEFLRGAKMAYNRLQQSWDRRDLSDIEQFATPAVMGVLKEQLAEDPTPSHTEIMMVNAQLVSVEDEGENQRAEVYFDVLMRENPDQQVPNSAREIWHFLRVGKEGSWKLDGIQQVG